MKEYVCDIRGCNNKADPKGRKIIICDGYKISSQMHNKITNYEPFENISTKKMDLCEEHLKKWAEATYNFLIINNKKDEEYEKCSTV